LSPEYFASVSQHLICPTGKTGNATACASSLLAHTSRDGDGGRRLDLPQDTRGYWFEVLKAKYLGLGKIPKPIAQTQAQKLAWKRFVNWVRFHKPKFPESRSLKPVKI